MNMKKLSALFLIIALLLTLATPAFAIFAGGEVENKTATLTMDGNTDFRLLLWQQQALSASNPMSGIGTRYTDNTYTTLYESALENPGSDSGFDIRALYYKAFPADMLQEDRTIKQAMLTVDLSGSYSFAGTVIRVYRMLENGLVAYPANVTSNTHYTMPNYDATRYVDYPLVGGNNAEGRLRVHTIDVTALLDHTDTAASFMVMVLQNNNAQTGTVNTYNWCGYAQWNRSTVKSLEISYASMIYPSLADAPIGADGTFTQELPSGPDAFRLLYWEEGPATENPNIAASARTYFGYGTRYTDATYSTLYTGGASASYTGGFDSRLLYYNAFPHGVTGSKITRAELTLNLGHSKPGVDIVIYRVTGDWRSDYTENIYRKGALTDRYTVPEHDAQHPVVFQVTGTTDERKGPKTIDVTSLVRPEDTALSLMILERGRTNPALELESNYGKPGYGLINVPTAANPNNGGKLTVSGRKVKIPSFTELQFPARREADAGVQVDYVSMGISGNNTTYNADGTFYYGPNSGKTVSLGTFYGEDGVPTRDVCALVHVDLTGIDLVDKIVLNIPMADFYSTGTDLIVSRYNGPAWTAPLATYNSTLKLDTTHPAKGASDVITYRLLVSYENGVQIKNDINSIVSLDVTSLYRPGAAGLDLVIRAERPNETIALGIYNGGVALMQTTNYSSATLPTLDLSVTISYTGSAPSYRVKDGVHTGIFYLPSDVTACSVVAAAYKANGELLEAISKSKADADPFSRIIIPFASDEITTGCTIRLFMFDTLNRLMPLSVSSPFNVQ